MIQLAERPVLISNFFVSEQQKQLLLVFLLVIATVVVIIGVPKWIPEVTVVETESDKPVSQEQLQRIDAAMQKWAAETPPPSAEELARLAEIMRKNDVNNKKP